MSDLSIIWQEVVEMLSLKLNNLQLQNWIDPLKPISLNNDCLVLDATSNFIANMVRKKYMKDIEEYLSYLCNKPIHVELTDPSLDNYMVLVNRLKYEPAGQSVMREAQLTEEPPVSSAKKTAQDVISDDLSLETPRIVERIREEKTRHSEQQAQNGYATLNPKYTMDSFVSGPSNEFAFAVAKGVVKNPGSAYNPFFIYGGSGLGKTHLMQAIAHEILRNDPQKKVLYTTSEKFMNEMIAMIENGTNVEKENFRKKYRSIDVILIDDIQFIAGKKATMEEVFHTFNDLKEANKQIVLSSDKPPKELKNLEERLVTRFEGGMTADIQPPDFETRVAILNHKSKQEGMELPAYAVEFIANEITSNIRELEGSFIRVIAFLRFKQMDPMTQAREKVLEITRNALNLEEKKETVIQIEDIIRIVEETYGLETGALSSVSKQNAIARPRQIAMYLARHLTSLSLVAIGKHFNRDHTTVLHGLSKIETKEKNGPKPEYKDTVEELTQKLKGTS
uniref:chromosomal replication initiator protein DnaA n=1 Tax=Ndongobacter massiliensis TaxID=1871025 RepID=UPI0009302E24|nr:chromosomal replication initiator protein DnaA [Ndongobacter massiliensis]